MSASAPTAGRRQAGVLGSSWHWLAKPMSARERSGHAHASARRTFDDGLGSSGLEVEGRRAGVVAPPMESAGGRWTVLQSGVDGK